MKIQFHIEKSVAIFIIAIMIIGFSYGCIGGSDNGTDSLDEQDYSMEKTVEIVSATCDSSGAMSFTIKNTGTTDIAANEIIVFVDDQKADEEINDEVALPLAPDIKDIAIGETSVLYTITGNSNAKHVLKVQAPAGTVQREMPC